MEENSKIRAVSPDAQKFGASKGQRCWADYLWGGQPPWKASKVPFRANIRARAQKNIHAQPLDDLEVACDVPNAVPLILEGVGLMNVPGDIQLHMTSILLLSDRSAVAYVIDQSDAAKRRIR